MQDPACLATCLSVSGDLRAFPLHVLQGVHHWSLVRRLAGRKLSFFPTQRLAGQTSAGLGRCLISHYVEGMCLHVQTNFQHNLSVGKARNFQKLVCTEPNRVARDEFGSTFAMQYNIDTACIYSFVTGSWVEVDCGMLQQ